MNFALIHDAVLLAMAAVLAVALAVIAGSQARYRSLSRFRS
jgi:hypothetical protein